MKPVIYFSHWFSQCSVGSLRLRIYVTASEHYSCEDILSIFNNYIECAEVERNLVSCVRTITCVTTFEQYFIFCESNIFVMANSIFQQFLNVLRCSSVIFRLRYGNWFPTSISRWNYTFKNACYVASSDYYLGGVSSKACAVSYVT